jgi:hypothetical protein
MWRLLSVLTLCGMPSLWADVRSGLPASPRTRMGGGRSNQRRHSSQTCQKCCIVSSRRTPSARRHKAFDRSRRS